MLRWRSGESHPDEVADFYPVETFASIYKDPARIQAVLEGI